MKLDTIQKRLLQEMASIDSMDDTDIIECSIEGYVCRPNFNKNLKNTFDINCDCELNNFTPLKKARVKNLKKQVDNDFKYSKDFDGSKKKCRELDDAVIAENYNKTPCSNRNNVDSNFIMKKIVSSVKKTPEGSYLSKSKLRNIENWLNDNQVEMIGTPPFANLSVTPASLKRKEVTSRKKEKKRIEKDSSIDSEVEDVLKAVYGDDWLKENVKSKSKTKPGRKPSGVCPSMTDIKKKRAGTCKTARRNILAAKNTNPSYNSDEEIITLENSFVSGVKKINFNDSDCSEHFLKIQNLVNVENIKMGVEMPGDESKVMFSDSKILTGLRPVYEKKTKENSSDKKNFKYSLLTPKKTFLASLSVSTPTSKCHPDAQFYKINFKSKKDELLRKLYKLYNNEVFDRQLAADMNFSWNIKLRGTAGYCYNKRITKSTGEVIRTSRIEFSTKIVDRADRLRDTMIHELCHAASWVIDGRLDGHGPIWSKWASKAMVRFPELPTIKRCHNYKVVSKFVYRCTACGYSINRHSKSIDIERKRCGYCYGVLELLVNKKRKGKSEVPEFDTTKTLRTPNKFALFVKDNYQNIKSSAGNAKHAEIMKILSQKYAVMKSELKSEKSCLKI